jgi:hypothetical protein
VLIAQKKAAKDQKVRRDLEALSEMSSIRIRNSSGVFEVSLVKVSQINDFCASVSNIVSLQVNVERGAVEILWDGGQKREEASCYGQTTGSKPTAEGAS